jgi:hypothetical protein
MNQNDLDWFAARLLIAIYDTNQEYLMDRLAQLKAGLGDVPGIETLSVRSSEGYEYVTLLGRTFKFIGNAPIDNIRRAMSLPKIDNHTSTTSMPTIAEQLKAARAQLAEARQGASNAVAESADASRVVLQEAEKVLKEAADLRAEVAELTNGGPA